MQFKGNRYVFQVGKRLGIGGMAEVLRGKAKRGPSEVAIKRPLAKLAPEHLQLFLREAEAAAQAAGPGVVRVIDWGEAPPFIAYELVHDPTLDREIRRRNGANEPWQITELIRIFTQLVSALKAINARVLHRDLKPANIFVAADQVKVGDFGLAKFVDEATRTRTFKGWGTAEYMPPEAWRNMSLDWRADQYSLGVIFFEMATLRRPFSGGVEELEEKHLYEHPPRVETLAPHVPIRLASVVARMLQKQKEDRFPSWDDLASEVNSVEQVLIDRRAGSVDPLAPTLVSTLQEHGRRELEKAKAANEATKALNERQRLVAYWWGVFSGKLKARLEQLNQEAGYRAINYTARDLQLEASLMNARLRFALGVVPLEGSPDVLGWGLLKATTPKSIAVTNLLLLGEPAPYGRWAEAQMQLSGHILGDIHPTQLVREGYGGQYEILGSSRVVVALDWAGLLAQRAIRNVVSFVDYREEAMDFDQSLNECLELFVREAAVQRLSDKEPER